MCSSETSVGIQRATWHYIPEDSTLHNHRCENRNRTNVLIPSILMMLTCSVLLACTHTGKRLMSIGELFQSQKLHIYLCIVYFRLEVKSEGVSTRRRFLRENRSLFYVCTTVSYHESFLRKSINFDLSSCSSGCNEPILTFSQLDLNAFKFPELQIYTRSILVMYQY
jgi:hypothetical protein